MRYPIVLFDLDHTLLDSTQSEADALRATFDGHSIDVTTDLVEHYQRINRSLWDALERGELGVNELRVRRFELLVQARDLGADPAAMADDFTHWLGQCGDLYDGSIEVLESLKGSVGLGLVTNGVGVTQRARIERHGLDSYFQAIVVSGEFGAAKPGVEIFDESLRQLGVDDRRGVLMVGDSLSSDMQGAVAAGLSTCWFNPARSAPPTDPRIDHDVADLGEIVPVVLGSSAS